MPVAEFVSRPRWVEWVGISRLYFGALGGSVKMYTKIYLSENYFFVRKHCSRPLQKKGVGGYMKEVKWSQPKTKTEGSQRATAYVIA